MVDGRVQDWIAWAKLFVQYRPDWSAERVAEAAKLMNRYLETELYESRYSTQRGRATGGDDA